jgi:adenylate kinase
MLHVVIFGPPGSGKGTQSERIIEKFGLAHISTGDILRQEIKNESELGRQAKAIIDRGELVPDNTIIGMLEKKMKSLTDAKGVIFDGFPRTVEQAKALKQMLMKRSEDVDVMLNLEVTREELIDRLLKRGQLSGRTDDNLETIEKRINVYEQQTSPVIDFYKNEGTYRPFEGAGDIDAIFIRIRDAINSVQ